MSNKMNDIGSNSMKQLFLSELKDKTNLLSKNILSIEQGEVSQKNLDELIQTSQSLKSGAGLAKLVKTKELSQVLHKIFVALQENNLSLNSAHINLLLESIDMLHTVTEGVNKDNSDVEGSNKRFDNLMTQLGVLTPFEKEAVKNNKEEEKYRDIKSTADKSIVNKTSSENTKTNNTLHLRQLFYNELKEKLDALAENLLAIEQGSTSAQRLEVLMRTAHSIKGGARLSNLHPAVDLAHVMEDIFVAAQKDELILEPEYVDVLLESADHLIAIAEIGLTKDEFEQQDTKNCEELTERLRTIISGEFVTSEEKSSVQVNNSEKTSELNLKANKDRFEQSGIVRVSTQNMDRIIGLAGELSVEARRAETLRQNILRTRHKSKKIAKSIGKLAVLYENDNIQQEARIEFDKLFRNATEIEQNISENISAMEQHNSHSAMLTKKMFNEVLSHRMRPFLEGVQGFHRLVRDLARTLGKDIHFDISGEKTQVDRDILEKLYAPLTHLIQNAVDHAIETPEQRKLLGKEEFGSIKIQARHKGGMLTIAVEDDGCGIDIEAVRKKVIEKKLTNEKMAHSLTDTELLEFLLLPNFTMKKDVNTLSGRGVGLDILREMLKEVRGTVHIHTQLGKYTRFELTLPITLAVVHCVIIELANEIYALPVARIETVLNLSYDDVKTLENNQYFTLHGREIGLVDGHQLLGLSRIKSDDEHLAVIVLGRGIESYAITVDRVLYEMDLVERPIDPRLGKLQDISAAAFLEDGTPVLILDTDDLIVNIEKLITGQSLEKVNQRSTTADNKSAAKRILVVDDSLTVREVERNLLSNKGFEVDVAIDGIDGWNAVRLKKYDIVLTDIDMPRLDGIELLEMIRSDSRLKDIPVIVISYKDREDDRMRGMKAGANHYLTKGSFHDDTLVEAVVDLIGEARTTLQE